MFGLFTVSRIDTRTPEEKRADFEKYCRRLVVPWDEDRTKFAAHLVIDHHTYNPTLLFDCKPFVYDRRTILGDNNCVFSPDRSWSYSNRILPFGQTIALFQNKRHGLVRFSGDIVVPVLSSSIPGDDVWMSITPAEVLTQRKAVLMARGDVMIGGLGLGYLLQKVCAKKSVKRVRVVEISQSQITWLRSVIEDIYPQTVCKVGWVCGDVREHINCFGKHTINLIDIWPGYGDSAGEPWIAEARKKGAKMWAWGESAYGSNW